MFSLYILCVYKVWPYPSVYHKKKCNFVCEKIIVSYLARFNDHITILKIYFRLVTCSHNINTLKRVVYLVKIKSGNLHLCLVFRDIIRILVQIWRSKVWVPSKLSLIYHCIPVSWHSHCAQVCTGAKIYATSTMICSGTTQWLPRPESSRLYLSIVLNYQPVCVSKA